MFKPYCLLRQTPNSSTFAFKSHVTHQDNNAADHSLMFQSNNIPTDCCHKKRSLYPVAALWVQMMFLYLISFYIEVGETFSQRINLSSRDSNPSSPVTECD